MGVGVDDRDQATGFSGMSTFDESKHRRGRGGEFAKQAHAEPSVALSGPGPVDRASRAVLGRLMRLDARPGVAARAAADPCPLVRLRALDGGYDLPDDTRRQLSHDPQVSWVAGILAGEPLTRCPA